MVESLCAAIAAQGWQALVVAGSSSADPDLAPFTGAAHLGETLLLVRPNGEVLIAPLSPLEREEAAATAWRTVGAEALDMVRGSRETESAGELLAWALQRLLGAGEVGCGAIGIAGRWRGGQLYEALRSLAGVGWSFHSAHETVEQWRKYKDESALETARSTTRGVRRAFRAIAEILAESTPRGGALWLAAEPVTPGLLRGRVAEIFARHGLEQPRGSIIAPAEEGAVPHNTGTDDRRLAEGESLVVDLFPKATLFSDCTRTFCVGSPPEALLVAHGEVAGALGWAHRHCRPGVSGWQLQQGVCDLFEKAGRPTTRADPLTEIGYVHGLGHGVGHELHELPSFREGAARAGDIAVGDLLTLEPGLYDAAAGYGVRLEDLVYIGEEENEVLTPLPYALDPRAWRD